MGLGVRHIRLKQKEAPQYFDHFQLKKADNALTLSAFLIP